MKKIITVALATMLLVGTIVIPVAAIGVEQNAGCDCCCCGEASLLGRGNVGAD